MRAFVRAFVSVHVFIPFADATESDISVEALGVCAIELVALVAWCWRGASDGCRIAGLELMVRLDVCGR
jgi:hypothetical protein